VVGYYHQDRNSADSIQYRDVNTCEAYGRMAVSGDLRVGDELVQPTTLNQI
jgi:hypothetical protein